MTAMKTIYAFDERIPLHCGRCHSGVFTPRGRRWSQEEGLRRLWQHYRCSVCGMQSSKVIDEDRQVRLPRGAVPSAGMRGSADAELKSRDEKKALMEKKESLPSKPSSPGSRFDSLLEQMEESESGS